MNKFPAADKARAARNPHLAFKIVETPEFVFDILRDDLADLDRSGTIETTELNAIQSDADHSAAMAEAARLWDAEAGTAKSDRLDLLIPLIEAYEAKHHAMAPPDCDELIEFRMEQQAGAKNRST